MRVSAANEITMQLLFGRSGEFYNRLYERGLVTDRFGASYGQARNFAYTEIDAVSDRPDELLREVCDEVARRREVEHAVIERLEARLRKGVERGAVAELDDELVRGGAYHAARRTSLKIPVCHRYPSVCMCRFIFAVSADGSSRLRTRFCMYVMAPLL